MIHNDYREIEVRFLEIEEDAFKKKLCELGAEDRGGDFLSETLFCDREKTWHDAKKFVRLRKGKKEITLTFKHRTDYTVTGTKEIEIAVNDFEKAKAFLEGVGLVAYREQEKKRHTFFLDGVVVDIDTWPSVPTYVELEGESEDALKQAADRLGLDWGKVIFEPPSVVIQKYYHIPIHQLKFFTFGKVE